MKVKREEPVLKSRPERELREMAERFASDWGPRDNSVYRHFVKELRELLEAYGRAALAHQSLPDTEHEHGDPT